MIPLTEEPTALLSMDMLRAAGVILDPRKAAIFAAAALVVAAGAAAGVGKAVACVVGVVAMFMNLGTRQAGTMSTWSVFNDGHCEMAGTLNAAAFEQELRHQALAPAPQEAAEEEFAVEDQEDLDLQRALENSLIHTSGRHIVGTSEKKSGKKKRAGVRRR